MPASRAPGRVLLRTAGILTQILGALCLLLGTITFVLVQQNKSGGSGFVVAWGLAALTALLFGGLMARGGLVSLLGGATLVAAFAIVLLLVDYDTVRGVFRVLPESDVEVLADGLTAGGIACLVVMAMCLASIPQALRYGRWLHEASGQSIEDLPAGSTAKGWAPPPTAKHSVWAMPAAPPEEQRSRRRMYIALAGFAIGFGAGIGVLVSSTSDDTRSGPPVRERAVADIVEDGSGSAGSASAPPPAEQPAVDQLLSAQKEMLENGDLEGMAALLAPGAIGFGAESDAFGEGRDALKAQLARDLGELASGATVTVKSSHVGEEGPHAWIAQELELTAAGKATKKLAVTQLASVVQQKWVVAAWHWAVLVPDAVAEEKKILGTLPAPRPVPNQTTGQDDLGVAVRAAFASRQAFADARSERADGFNFGSGPGERSIGGRGIKRVFGKLRAQIRVHDGVRAVSGDAWGAAPTIGVAALNVDFSTKSRALTDLTQTFRVLAVLVKEDAGWKIVSTQWSHGGPIL